MIKQLVKKIFNLVGLEVRKKIHAPLNNSVAYNSKENMDKFYADAALVARYEDERRISFYTELIKNVSQAVDFHKVSSIADVSAGTGRLLKEFRQKFPDKKYYGFEFSDGALKLCKKDCPDISFEKIDLYVSAKHAIPQGGTGINKSFDLILCVDTLEHLEYPERAIQNMLDMLTPYAHLCLIVPNGRYDTFEGHIHYWSPESFRLFLEKINCEIKCAMVWDKYVEQCIIVKRKTA